MRTYFRTLFCVLLAVSPVVLIQVTAKPTRPAPPKEAKPATFPDIAGETNWGRLDVDKTGYFTITQHPTWTAEGQILAGGKRAYVLWTLVSNGRLAPGIYEIGVDGGLAGVWL
jgi:hypothetical protein